MTNNTTNTSNKQLGYLAVDQYGDMIRLNNPNKPPRKQLLDKLGRQHTAKIYRDSSTPGKEPQHVGYIVAERWFDVYEVHEWQT